MGETWTVEQFHRELANYGETEVAHRVRIGAFGAEDHQKRQLAVKWLDDQKLGREIASREGAAAREDERNRLAREANSIAKSANRQSGIAIAISVLALAATIALALWHLH